VASQFCQFYLRDGEEPLHWFPDSSFDVALAITVYHHIADVDFSLAELVRCLKPGGLLVIHEVVDDDPIFRILRSAHPDYRGMPVLSRMRSSDWLACFNRNSLKVLAAFGMSFCQMGKWALMLHAFRSTFRDTNPFYPRALFPLFTAIPVGTHHFRPVHVLYVLQKTGAFT
jgi:SAM-dependent methyltransferase